MTKHDAERKVRILDFIAATLRARGYPPSVREIMQAVGLASTSAVHHHLQMLVREGYLERGEGPEPGDPPDANAAIRLGLSSELVPQATTADSRVVPIIGEIAAGGPIEAYQDASGDAGRPGHARPSGDAYVLRVRGDSMIEAHIADGDFVLIRPQSTARNGDIVVAQVEENAVTLKRFFKEKDKIRLQPANPEYPPSSTTTCGSRASSSGSSASWIEAARTPGLRCRPPRLAHAPVVRSLRSIVACLGRPASRFSLLTCPQVSTAG